MKCKVYCENASMTDEQRQASLIISILNQEAENHGLRINWSKTNIERKYIEFEGGDDHQIENFSRWLCENFDEIILN